MEYTEDYDKQAQGIPESGYWYEHTIRSYILQFMAVFAGLQVKVGRLRTAQTVDTTDCDGNVVSSEPVFLDPRLISVPIHYGAADKVVGSILADNTQNKLLRLPAMSAYFKGIEHKKEYFAGLGQERRNSYVPSGGLVPDDIKVIYQRKPVPYALTMELGLFASNTDQHLQMLEQILLIFNPQLQIQTTDSLFDWTKISHVELKDVSVDTIYPSLADRRVIQSTMTFEVICYLDTPAEIKRNFVERIYARIGAIGDADQSNYDIIAQFDQEGIDYRAIFDDDTLPFN